MAENSSNSEAGSQTESKTAESKATESKATESKATETSKSSGNFSGGFDSSALSDKSLSTDSTPDFGIDFGTNNNKSFGFGDNLFGDSGFDFGKGISDSDSSKTSETVGKSEPVMTVDEVYGKGNQSIVERQGDYAASSNEKSNVETSTFGKQDNISVTPTSVTENKGIVGNDTIQSVEGLDFQQKDKASQEVLDGRKKRDEAEAENKTNQMKDSLLSKIGKPIGKPGNGDVSQFQVGNRDEDLAAVQKELEQASKVKNDVTTKAQESDEALNAAEGNVSKTEASHEKIKSKVEAGKKVIEHYVSSAKSMAGGGFIEKAVVERSKEFSKLKDDISKLAESYGADIGDISNAKIKDLVNIVNVVAESVNKTLDNALKKSEEDVAKAKQQRDEVAKRNEELWSKAVEADVSFEALRTKYNDIIKSKFEEATEEPVTTEATEEPVTTETPATTAPVEETDTETSLDELKDDINNSDLSPEQKDRLNGALADVENSKANLIDAAAKARSGNQADLVAYENAVREYNNNLKVALNMGNAITQTGLNRKFTKHIAASNDFEVTLADGTKMKYDKFAIDEAAKSPDYAEAIYNQQADDYAKKAATATNGIMKTYYNVKSELASWKAQLSKDLLGSKVVGADNAFRNQFIQMAKTDERATVNAYNDILNDKTGKYSEADKAEASAALNQSKSLMTAATALKYSTGTLSGIGDDVKDGTYGTTNPELLKTHQKIISKVDNIAKITLGLGVTPAANKGWANMYYMAGDKASQSSIFNRDWDKDGISMTREYGNNATAGIIGAVCELGLGIALSFSPSTAASGANLIADSFSTFIDSLYGVRKAAKNAVKANNEILGYFNEARDIVKSSGNEDAIKAIDDAASMFLTQTKQTEDFQLKSDEVGNLDNWLEGSGSNTADNGKFNQALTYDEWLKLIEADPVMQEYAKSLNR